MTGEKDHLYEEAGRAPDPIVITSDNRVYSDLIQVYNNLGRALHEEAGKMGVSTAQVAALVRIVSSGRAFDNQGRLLISFSPELFHRFWGKDHQDQFDEVFRFVPDHPGKSDLFSENRSTNFLPFHQVPDMEWSAFDMACAMDMESAVKSTAMGLGQIMGFNFEKAGFSSASEMFGATNVSVRAQLKALMNFIGQTSGLVAALESRNYLEFCRKYFNHSEAENLAKRMDRLTTAYRTLTGSRKIKAF